MQLYRLSGIIIVLVMIGCSDEPDGLLDGLSEKDLQLVNAMLQAEDARPSERSDLQPLYEGLTSSDPEIRRLAVRGLGRLEQPGLVTDIIPLLRDEVTAVQTTAANALAQSAYRGDISIAYPALLQIVKTESSAELLGAAAQALGRLPVHGSDTLALVEQALFRAADNESPSALVGIMRGFESFYRRHRDHDLTDESASRLKALAAYGLTDTNINDDSSTVRIRRLAVASLTAAGQMTASMISESLEDPDTEVRRLAVRSIDQLQDPEAEITFYATARADSHAAVRTEALRVYGRSLQKAMGCLVVLQALDDPNPHVAITAIDLLSSGCERGESHTAIVNRLSRLSATLADDEAGAGTWHKPAHALTALAGLAPTRAEAAIHRLAEHSIWQVRMYAARAAATTRDRALLERLSEDTHPNVASTALNGLHDIAGHDADSYYITALKRDDYQLLLTAARRLEGSRHPDALPALVEAFVRVSRDEWETSRDPRRMMLTRIGEMGDPSAVETLRPYLKDFDPLIADLTAEIITRWTGDKMQADPQPLTPLPVPDVAALRDYAALRPVLIMADGSEITLQLRPLDAATNVARFVRLSEKGYFDGLTFHRVVPNFVIQGGSPGANEFMGDGPFSRDELTSASHLRGTIGISTRGRDTGDAQIFVNLVDNVRLDHNYTIIGEVIEGMDAVDGLLEGATIREVRLR